MATENRMIPEACCTLDISGDEQDKLVMMFKALGNPTRFEIMKFLVTHPGCITGDIVEMLPIAQAVHNSGGTVIAQVARLLDHPAPPQQVRVPVAVD